MSELYWLIERQKTKGGAGAHWFSKRVHSAGGSYDLWVEDVTRAERFKTKEDAERSIYTRFIEDEDTDRYPVTPIATEHMDMTTPNAEENVK